MTAHPGSFCAPAGGTDVTKSGTEMVCSVAAVGGRARWRRNGPAPARRPRGKRAPKSVALPVVDAGIQLPPAPVPAPVPASAPAELAKEAPVRVDGHHTDREPLPNEWGSVPRRGANHCTHFDGPLTRQVEALGADARIDMGDGVPLADTLGDLGDAVRRGDLHPGDLPNRLKDVRDRLPEGSTARGKVNQMMRDVDAPWTPVPVLPESTPAPLYKLVHDLYAIPVCRQDPGQELDRLRDLARRFNAGQITGRELEAGVGRVSRHEMFSDTGSIQINRAILAAKAELVELRRASRTQG